LKENAKAPKEQSTSGLFLSLILRENDRSAVKQINPAMKREEKLQELRLKIHSEVDKYYLHCRSMDWLKTLEQYPTENYEGREEVELLCSLNDTHIKTPLWLAHRFDVLAWWRKVGMLLFPLMAVGAPIILAKPAHNGYQERVFSLGKFCDSPLRNKQTADNFKMRVLDTINKNNKSVQTCNNTFIEDKDSFVKNFFTYENVAKILSTEEKTDVFLVEDEVEDEDSTTGEDDDRKPKARSGLVDDYISDDDEDFKYLDDGYSSSSSLEDEDDCTEDTDGTEDNRNKELVIQL
jgi:hypothetical protein